MTDRIFFEPEAATFLDKELRIPIKRSTLASKRRTGGGPAYRRVLGRVEYTEADLRAWAESLRAKAFVSTAQEPKLCGPRRTQVAP